MITIRKSKDRGRSEMGWLSTKYTFSFANYYDPDFMGFRSLRVINEDVIEGNQGFGAHPHGDMEIITYIISGKLEHQDSMGHSSISSPGDVQYMNAGTGVEHSEFNASNEPLHLMQIWIEPPSYKLPPHYEQKYFPPESKLNKLCLLVSNEKHTDSILCHQNLLLYAGILESGKELSYQLIKSRGAWIQIIFGSITVNGIRLEAGDGASIESEPTLQIIAEEKSEFILFDLV